MSAFAPGVPPMQHEPATVLQPMRLPAWKQARVKHSPPSATGEEQPQLPFFELHFGPGLQAVLQVVQKPPLMPQAASALPARHWPFGPEQQPPLQVETPTAPQRLVQLLFAVSQA